MPFAMQIHCHRHEKSKDKDRKAPFRHAGHSTLHSDGRPQSPRRPSPFFSKARVGSRMRECKSASFPWFVDVFFVVYLTVLFFVAAFPL
jgi:hypothetical protein